jgi:hypothetical protein
VLQASASGLLPGDARRHTSCILSHTRPIHSHTHSHLYIQAGPYTHMSNMSPPAAPLPLPSGCSYLWLITPVVYMSALCECLKRYLLAQRVVVPAMIITIATALVAPLYNWLLLFKWVAARTASCWEGRSDGSSTANSGCRFWALQECALGCCCTVCRSSQPGGVGWVGWLGMLQEAGSAVGITASSRPRSRQGQVQDVLL